MSEKDLQEIRVENMIFDLLVSMGISPQLRGFRLLEYCIKDEVLRKRDIGATELYSEIAQQTKEPWENVVRAMYFAIKKAVKAVGADGIAQRIGPMVPLRGRIEPQLFVRYCARKIRGEIV